MAQRGTRRASTNTDEKRETQGPAPDPTAALASALEIFNEDFKELNLHGKIAAISGHLGRIPKNGYNKFNGYAYVLESDLVEAIRYYLAAARILIYPESIREHTVFTFEGQTTGQNNRNRDILTDNIYVYRVTDGQTGETFTFEANGQGSDPRDKGANKASTGAMKFAFLRLFNISSGEDEPERDEQGDQKAAEQSGEQKPVTVTGNNVEGTQRGGKQEKATGAQIKAVSNLSNQLGLGGPGLAALMKKTLDITVELPENEAEHGKAFLAVLKEMTGEDIGKLIYQLQEAVRAAEADDGGSGY